ncbi:chaoptin isoform X2 [Athalia rosae]|uniref:chaoptin isoform X2 n=1 Tax=Athalia rosae TaxID=37344 RepID=UPI002033A2EE|nr:chaoptin isoform X2 [Athalia rosae]XP_048512672.1 chaoptin isoform X2 [Athalia rosae]XP_048512673.1 chaoptin isoform X2 [Athalia rosae]
MAYRAVGSLSLSSVILGLISTLTYSQEWRPCVEIKRDLYIPCKCSLSSDHGLAIVMNCDGVIFTRDTTERLKRQPIVSFSQKNVGYKKLPEDLIAAGLPLEMLDLSGNSIQRLMDRLLNSQNRLEELRLAENLLGDNLNPIFSSNEFHEMAELRVLDLAKNGLRSIEEGIFKGCQKLEELYLDDNNLTHVPAASLKGPQGIKLLSLSRNNIGTVMRDDLVGISESLERLDLSWNILSHMDDEAFAGLGNLTFLNVSHNDLTRFNSDVFKGILNLRQLDLSMNYLKEFPTEPLRHLDQLTFLNIANNLISNIEQAHLSRLAELQVLDLSRNNIGRLGVRAFFDLSSLVHLDLSLNALRTIEESSFEGLVNLKWISLQDNNILLLPGSALSRLPALTHLHIEYNRIAALSIDLLRSASPLLQTLGLSRNLIREIPARLFENFKGLTTIQLSDNALSSLLPNTFFGIEDTLQNLDLSHNRLTTIGELPSTSLISLNLAGNNLKRVSPETFSIMGNLQQLNLSNNPLYGGFPPIFPPMLKSLDISYTGLKILPSILFRNLEHLQEVSVAGNYLQEIGEGTFQYLYNLSSIVLSFNAIESIQKGAFVNLINLYKLDLRSNKLVSFGGEFFNTGTGLEVLNLSDNFLSYLSPTAFIIHPRLREINLSNNRFIYFPSDFIKSLQFLNKIDLSLNKLVNINEFAFSQLARLKTLDISNNKLESVDELAFHNSTQLQTIRLAGNNLELLSDRTMEGILRLEHLDLSNNKLASLPETMFDPTRIQALENINLSGNRFDQIPVKALKKQSHSLNSLNMAHNRLVEVFNQDIVGHLKELDLSGNPLSPSALRGILGEAKVLRSLNLANTGIESLTRLETPFLRHLNISGNNISDFGPIALERTTLLETLDISRNNLRYLANMTETFRSLPVLQTLDVSSNAIRAINDSSFVGLNSLRELRIVDLPNCNRIERSAFKTLKRLQSLHGYNYPRLGYFDVRGILKYMNGIEVIDIEIKDSSIGNEQLSIRSHPRLRSMTLRGDRLRNILSSSLVGVRHSDLTIGLKNTSIDTIPNALFFPVPRSTRVTLDVSGSQFTNLPQQFIVALEERSDTITLKGLDSNPVKCDCQIIPLWRWVVMSKSKMKSTIKCASPVHLAGQYLVDINEAHLSCDVGSSAKFETTDTTTSLRSTILEPEIIWTAAPPTQDNKKKKYHSGDLPLTTGNSPTTTDDTLVIGIVGGVFAFIAIVVIIICICRLRWSNHVNGARMAAMASSIHEASVVRPGSTYSGKANQEIYMGSYNGSMLGHGNNMSAISGSPIHTPLPMMPFVQPMRIIQPMHRPIPQPVYGYYENPNVPIYMTYASEDKFDR